MAYNNYSFVIDSSFKPFSFQEMLAPFALYKDEYDKTQEAYHQLMDKAEDFSYLAKVADDDPDNGRSAQIYKGYANELKKYAQDLAHNGLSVGNKQGYLGLRNRYKGEIGRLENADKVLQEVLKSRRDEKDASMLYGTNNLTLDQFLDNQTPNMYKVSGNDLYAKGQAAGKAASSRVYSFGDMGSTLGGYYRMWGERNGYSADSINAFRANAAAIPELQQAADSILKETGAYDNLSGNNLERARQGVINGIIDGAVTNESVKPIEDKSKVSASAAMQYGLQREARDFERQTNGYYKDANGNWQYDPERDIQRQVAVEKAAAVAAAKQSGKSSSGSGSGSGASYNVRNKSTIMVGANSGTKYKTEDDDKTQGTPIGSIEGMRIISDVEKAKLVDSNGNIVNQHLKNAIGNGNLEDYEIWVLPSGSTSTAKPGLFNDDNVDEDIYIAVPRETKREASESGYGYGSSYGGYGIGSDDDLNYIPE